MLFPLYGCRFSINAYGNMDIGKVCQCIPIGIAMDVRINWNSFRRYLLGVTMATLFGIL